MSTGVWLGGLRSEDSRTDSLIEHIFFKIVNTEVRAFMPALPVSARRYVHRTCLCPSQQLVQRKGMAILDSSWTNCGPLPISSSYIIILT